MNQHKHKYKTGLVVGKFYPPHRGHKYLIDTATEQCENVTVIVLWKRSETIPGSMRADWLRKIHPNVFIKIVEDYKLDDDDSEGWAKFTLDILGYVPDAVFTSESYGDPYAGFMGAIHVLVDRDRVTIPISATMVRSKPREYAEFLEPSVRAFFAHRVCVLGAESTGTTTLSKALAKHYKTVWAPEYGRFYSEGRLYAQESDKWRTEEFETIARAQNVLEDSLAEQSNGLVICDTDAFATGVWHERYLGTRSQKVEEIGDERHHVLYILTGDEIPFVQDGLRDGEKIRSQMHQTFIQRLKHSNKHFIIVTGSSEQRLKQAITAIDQL